jgi:hypothetical protein
MPKQKNQHYVPKCHLKPFSMGAKGLALNLFNMAKARSIMNAAVRGQCAKDYFHGPDLKLEGALGKVETEYARIVHPTAAQTSIAADDMSFLCTFAYLQYHRTATALKRRREADLDMLDAIYSDTPDTPPEIDLSDRALIQESMEHFEGLRYLVDDLKCCLVRNKTPRDFVTSDDPAILTNRFYMQRLNRDDFGIGSSGVMLVLPLTPRSLLICYDSGVYTVPDKTDKCIDISDVADVLALNELQYIKATENIYFSKWSECDLIAREFETFRHKRPASWHVIHMAVPTDEDPTVYREVSREEARTAPRSLVHHQTLFPRPTVWLSKLKHRTSPRAYSNGSSAGYVRKREHLRGF